MSTAVYPLAMRCDKTSPSTALAVMETMFGAGTTIGPFIGEFHVENVELCQIFIGLLSTLRLLCPFLRWTSL